MEQSKTVLGESGLANAGQTETTDFDILDRFYLMTL